jgi:SsrA-binding protein
MCFVNSRRCRYCDTEAVTRSGTTLYLAKKKKKPSDNTIAVNRIAYRNYEILDTMEAGISLTGTEVKSIRDGRLNLRDGFIKPTKNGRSCLLMNVHIGKCSQVGPFYQHEETRPRTLLVHKEQARKLLQQTDMQGMTIVPLKAYFSDKNKVKLQIAVCRGKNVRDKRATIKERDAKRETNRIIKNFSI